jgi:excisionase family DNA binding protein
MGGPPKQFMKILTCKQVAEILQAKPSTVYAWAEQSLIPCFKINGLLRFDETEIMQWIKNCKEKGSWYNSPIQTRSPKKGGKVKHGAI